MAEKSSSDKRLPYIDKLKALAMLLVVMGHTIYFCTWHETSFNDAVFSIICTFHVPLFFFLSGFVIKEPATGRKLVGKVRRFMMPMLVVGFINALLIHHVSDFFLDGAHNGYWYLLTLTLFYLLMVPFHINKYTQPAASFLADVLIALTVWLFIMLMNMLCCPHFTTFNWYGAFIYWPFFTIGYMTRKYQLNTFIQNRPIITVLLSICYLLLLMVSYFIFHQISNLPLLIEFTLAFTAIAALMALFHHFNNSQGFVSRQLKHIGNHTLHIYVFHYFFIRFIDLSFLKTAHLSIELLVIFPLTVTIAYASIAIGKTWDYLCGKSGLSICKLQ